MPEKAKTTDAKEAEAAVSAAAGSSGPETCELVFTVNKATGEVVKVEESNQAGARREFNDDEYSTLAAYTGGADLSGLEAYGYDPLLAAYAYQAILDPSYEQGYYHGMADYAAAVEASTTEATDYTPEELAYFQGMADYAASLC